MVQHFINWWLNMICVYGPTFYHFIFMVKHFINSWLDIIWVHGSTIYHIIMGSAFNTLLIHGWTLCEFMVQHFIYSWLNIWIDGSTFYQFMVEHTQVYGSSGFSISWLELLQHQHTIIAFQVCGFRIDERFFCLFQPAYNNLWAEWNPYLCKKNCAFKVCTYFV